MAQYSQIQGDLNTMNEAQRNEAVIRAGYTGYNDYLDNANKISQGGTMTNAQVSGQGSSMGATGANLGGMFGTQQASLDLPSLYKNLYSSSGISSTEARINELEKQYIEARNKISNNPFLDASTVDKRLSRLKQNFELETSPLKSEITTKKADIDTQMGLQTKQFDINNTVTQNAINQFNTLLSSGALSNASAEDIATITKATGLSGSMIQSAVTSMKAKNLQTTVQTYDDGTNQGYKIITIDPYGNIVNSKTEILGPSSKTTSPSGNAYNLYDQTSGGSGSSSQWKIVTPSSSNISDGWNIISSSSTGSSSSKSYLGTNWTNPSSGKNYTYTNMGWA